MDQSNLYTKLIDDRPEIYWRPFEELSEFQKQDFETYCVPQNESNVCLVDQKSTHTLDFINHP